MVVGEPHLVAHTLVEAQPGASPDVAVVEAAVAGTAHVGLAVAELAHLDVVGDPLLVDAGQCLTHREEGPRHFRLGDLYRV